MSSFTIHPLVTGEFRVETGQAFERDVKYMTADAVYDFVVRFLEEHAGYTPTNEDEIEDLEDDESWSINDVLGDLGLPGIPPRAPTHANDAEPGYFGVASS